MIQLSFYGKGLYNIHIDRPNLLEIYKETAKVYNRARIEKIETTDILIMNEV